jgi:hypothetical protein
MRNFIFAIFVLSILAITASIAFGQDSGDCVVIAPDFLQDGSQEWCDLGMFIEVRVSADEELKTMYGKMTFNTAGYYIFTEKEKLWVEAVGEIQIHMANYGIRSTLEFYFGEAKLMTCTNKLAEVSDEGAVITGPGNDCVNNMEAQ